MSGPDASAGPTALPLAGIRVLDLTTVLAGPYAAQILGDLGADVIKIEAPGGDSTRSTGPAREPGMAAAYLGANRNKRSVVLDLKRPEAREALLALVDGADVLVCSIRRQKLAQLGIAPDVLRARNPRLVVVSIQGFGSDGAYAGRPAYDDTIQGLCGLASLGGVDGEPRYLPSVVADKTCALFAATAACAALVARGVSGAGTEVEVPMLECMTSFTLVEHQAGGHFVPPVGEPGYARLLTPWRRPYPTRDGHVCAVPYTDGQWARFFEEVGRSDLAGDARFAGMAARTENIDALYAEVARCLVERTTAEWLEAFDRIDVPAAALNRLQDLASDPHLASVNFFHAVDDPAMGTMQTTRAPLRFGAAPPPVPRLPPRLGEHTREVLREAGVAAVEIDRLLAADATRAARGDA